MQAWVLLVALSSWVVASNDPAPPSSELSTPMRDLCAAATAPAETVRQTYARVVLTVGDKTYKHPGFFAYVGEEAVFSFEIGGKVHEIAVGIEGEEAKGYDLDVMYKKGATMVLSGKGKVKAGASLTLSEGKSKVEVFIDPHGQVDKGRRKKIDGPDSDDPLG